MKKNFLIIFGFLIISGCDQNSFPKDYDDCILKNMKGVNSDHGANQIMSSCREKFPEGSEYKYKERDLEIIELMLLTGKAGLQFGNTYSGSIYNGNEQTTVTSVKIKVTEKTSEEEISREYIVKVKIPPLTTSEFRFNIIPGEKASDYSWGIVGGRGFK